MSRSTSALVCAVLSLAAACENRTQGASSNATSESPPAPGPAAAAPPAPAPQPPPAPASTDVAVRAEPVSFAPIAHAADPSVVTITTASEELEVSPFTHRRRRSGLGTGFVVDKGGVVVTNNHVVEGAALIQVKLFDDREYEGKVVGTDPPTDIAVVRIDAKDLRPLRLGDSDAMDVGDWVVAIGNPFGLSHTVSAGIVSAKGRTQQDLKLDSTGYYDFIQTDASINPGNSGGPLLNLRGEVVGINAAIRGGGAQNIGFAIPINMVKQLLPMLLRDGHVTRSALGVRIVDVHELTADDRAALSLPQGDRLSGAVVEYVVPGGPAARGGVQAGDLIVGYEGQPIERSAQLQWLASTSGVGRTVTVHVQRANKQFDAKVALGRLDEGPSR
jgi:serine protease Do